MIIEMHETKPLKINQYLICENNLLMNMIKLFTQADKIEQVHKDCDISH